jgi:hypothetical protein
MPNRTEARPAKAAFTNATGRLPLVRLFSTPLIDLGRNRPGVIYPPTPHRHDGNLPVHGRRMHTCTLR